MRHLNALNSHANVNEFGLLIYRSFDGKKKRTEIVIRNIAKPILFISENTFGTYALLLSYIYSQSLYL